MLKIGILGCGNIGRIHIKAWKNLSKIKSVQVVAISDFLKTNLEKALKVFPKARVYNDGENLLKKEDLDIIDICLPSFQHSFFILQSMQKNLNIFCEKPVCLNEKECSNLLLAQKDYSKKIMIGHVLRFFPEYELLKEVYKLKTYGKLKSLTFERLEGDIRWGYNDWFHDASKSGSVLMDLHIHDVDFVFHLLGKPQIIDIKVKRFKSQMINSVKGTYKFNDIDIKIKSLWDKDPSLAFKASYKAEFERGFFIYDSLNEPKVQFWATKKDKPSPILFEDVDKSGNLIQIKEQNNPYFRELNYFISCINNNTPIKTATLEQSIASIRFVLSEKTFIEKKES